MKLVPENINEAVKHLAPRSKEELKKYAKTTTVNNFFKWYSGGDSKWYESTDILTAMIIDDVHAEDEDKEFEHLKFFKDNKNEKISVYTAETRGGYDLEFNLNGKNICVQSLDPAMAKYV